MKKISAFLFKHRHWGTHAVVFLLLASSVMTWIPMGNVGHRVTGVLVILGLYFSFTAQLRHDPKVLCEGCISSMPLDPGRAVERRKPVLAYVHLLRDNRHWDMIYLTFLLGCTAFLAFGPMTPYSFTFNSFCTMENLVLVGTSWSSIVHLRLKQWCPYCKPWDEGGDHEVSPDPIVPERA